MNSAQFVLSQLVKAVLVVTVAGIFVRRTYRQCFAFPVYLLLVLTCDSVVSLWPGRFYKPWFWIIQQSIWDLGKLAIAAELGFRFFRAFPRARSVARFSLVVVAAITTGVVMRIPPGITYTAVVFDWHPQVLTGTIWLLTSLALVVTWYRLPIRPFQKAILIGFVPYLVVFVTLLNVERAHGWKVRPWVNLVDAMAYLLVTTWWAVAAWRSIPSLDVAPAVLGRLGMEST